MVIRESLEILLSEFLVNVSAKHKDYGAKYPISIMNAEGLSLSVCKNHTFPSLAFCISCCVTAGFSHRLMLVIVLFACLRFHAQNAPCLLSCTVEALVCDCKDRTPSLFLSNHKCRPYCRKAYIQAAWTTVCKRQSL